MHRSLWDAGARGRAFRFSARRGDGQTVECIGKLDGWQGPIGIAFRDAFAPFDNIGAYFPSAPLWEAAFRGDRLWEEVFGAAEVREVRARQRQIDLGLGLGRPTLPYIPRGRPEGADSYPTWAFRELSFNIGMLIDWAPWPHDYEAHWLHRIGDDGETVVEIPSFQE